MVYSLINFYCKHFSFPKRGLKYFIRLLRATKCYNAVYLKKLHNKLYFRTNPSEHIQKQIFWYGFYEREAVLLMEKLMQPNTCFIDIGANTGYYSICASKYSEAVFAFEPSPEHVEEIRKNIELNSNTNIEVIPYALSNENITTTYYYSDAENLGMGGLTAPTNFSGVTAKVATVVLDEWLAKKRIKNVGLIKMDIEGAEYNALLGMVNMIGERLPMVMIEIDNTLLARFKYTAADIFLFFRERNYLAYEIVKSNTIKRIATVTVGDSILFVHSSKNKFDDIDVIE
jgi:FkbM family methyltransferase